MRRRIEVTLDDAPGSAGPAHRRRQRPRHAGRRASQISGQVGARSDHDHAPFGRQVLRQGLCDLGRPARRRRLGGQRAVDRHRGRGGAQQAGLPPDLRARPADLARWRRSAPTQNRRGTTVAFTPDAEIFGRGRPRSSRRGSTGWRAPRPISSPGVEIRWKCDPALLSDDDRKAGSRPRRCSSFPAGSPTICKRADRGQGAGDLDALHRQA